MQHPMRTAPRPRLVVLGLDGLPFSLARALCAAGRLPHLAALALGPRCRPIHAELPELSPVNWTSFYTAAAPGEHGVFGFTRIHPHDYTIALADFAQVTAPTIYDRLGERGLVSKVVNLPNTYPARAFAGGRGMLVAGFVAPDLRRAVHPPFLAAPLAAAGYRLEADTWRGKTDPDFLLGDLSAMLDARRKALDLLWPDLAWDTFTFVLTETDRLFHFLFHAVAHAGHPLHAACLDFLDRWDALVGEVLSRYAALPEPKRLIALADHGFTELIVEVDVNVWLREQGLLTLSGPLPAHELDASRIAPATRAFALDPGRIYLHTAARFGRGGVSQAEAPALATRIRDGLMALRWKGQPVMTAVHTGATLYSGSLAHAAPDLVCEAHPGFDLKAKFDRATVFGRFGRTGAHTAGDAFYYDSDANLTATTAHGPADRPFTPRHAGMAVLDHFGISCPGLLPN